MPDPNPIKKSANVIAWLRGKSAAELAAIRRGAHNYYPDAITIHDADGTPREEKILIRVPSVDDRAIARVDAIRWVAKKVPKSFGTSAEVRNVEDAKKFIGAEVFDEIDTCAIAARCMHDPTIPTTGSNIPPPWKDLDLLLTDHRTAEILDVFERMSLLARMFSPRFDELTEQDFWLASKFVAETENASPLAAMSAGMQLAFLTWACKQAMRAMPNWPSS